MTASTLDAVAETTASEPVAARAVGLRKVFGSTVAVDDIDLEVPTGSVLGMLGPNGSGKTTLIRMLLGLSRPTAGSAELLGYPIPDGAAAALPHVGALVEGPGFHPFLSGRDNLLRIAATEPLLASREIPGAVDGALERVGLADAAGRRYRGYSLGMKQRLGLAGALLLPRRLVVLDEPTNGLDPAGTRDVRRIIAELHAAESTVIVSSHLLAEVEATCTHVAVLQAGSLVAAGELAAMLESGAGGLDVVTPDVEQALAALREARITAHPASGDEPGIVVADDGPPTAETIALLVRAGVTVHEARRRRARLEELFARLTERSLSERASDTERSLSERASDTERSLSERASDTERSLSERASDTERSLSERASDTEETS